MKRFLTIFFVALFLMSLAQNAFACACCAHENSYSVSTDKPDSFIYGLLGEMKFENKAVFFVGEADYSDLRGLSIVNEDWNDDGAFDFVNEFTNKSWKLTFKTAGGKTGTLTLPVPTQMTKFKVDMHETKDTGVGVTLYKEFRFKGTVRTGTGFFRSGIVKPTTYFLVFQGRGNYCDDASDFTHWHLDINGKNADYSLNGKLKSGNEEETEKK